MTFRRRADLGRRAGCRENGFITRRRADAGRHAEAAARHEYWLHRSLYFASDARHDAMRFRFTMLVVGSLSALFITPSFTYGAVLLTAPATILAAADVAVCASDDFLKCPRHA